MRSSKDSISPIEMSCPKLIPPLICYVGMCILQARQGPAGEATGVRLHQHGTTYPIPPPFGLILALNPSC